MKCFDEVYEKYFKDVYKYILSISRSRHVAEEITQENFFRALKNIKSFRGDCDLRIWLCQIAKNEYFRMREKGKRFDRDLIPEYSSEDDTESDFIKREDAFHIHRILHDIEEPYKEVFSVRTFARSPRTNPLLSTMIV